MRQLGFRALLLAVSLVLVACSDAPASSPGGTKEGSTTGGRKDLQLVSVSTRSEYVTGGDVTVAVLAPDGSTADPASATLSVNGTTVTPRWTKDRSGRTITTIDSLRDGVNEISASLGTDSAELRVVNHALTGPLFSGPALPMPVCSTEAYGLGPATDPNCSAPTRTTWTYRSTDGSMKPLADPKAIPADVATVTEGPNAGKRYIIREEAGVINRSIYWITVLDPEPASPSFDGSGWNGRLVYQFGGGCGTTYTQGFLLLSRAPQDLIAQGYATATGTLNTFQVMCNDVLSAETALAVKEHFSETYGPPVFTIGSGGSGGAIQQYLIANNYPGILDAVGATLPFPDAFSIAPGVVDCVLLNGYYASPAGAALTPEQRTAINGHASTKTCDFWASTFAQNIRPDTGCSLDILANAGGFVKGLPSSSGQGGAVPKVPGDQRYDPVTNRDGLRCTMQDGMVNVLGKDPLTGFARRPLDNTGVQYGLAALNSGVITPGQFLDLNEKIGGVDIDGRPVPERMKATEENIRPVYETGRVVEGGGPLDTIPVITVNVYTDDQGDIHDRFRAFSLRDRLRRPDQASSPNHMIWTRGVPKGQSMIDALTGTIDVGTELVATLDEWLTNISKDRTDATATQRLEKNRPTAAIDNCIDSGGQRLSGLDIYDKPGPCRDLYQIHGDPRTASGAPRRNDIGKCQLQPTSGALGAKVVTADFTPEQTARYEKLFPEGVCDWNRPGVGQVPTKGPWQDYTRST